jgi:hypothetical protein
MKRSKAAFFLFGGDSFGLGVLLELAAVALLHSQEISEQQPKNTGDHIGTHFSACCSTQSDHG